LSKPQRPNYFAFSFIHCTPRKATDKPASQYQKFFRLLSAAGDTASLKPDVFSHVASESWHPMPSSGVHSIMRVAAARVLAVLLVASASLNAADPTSPELSQLIIALQGKAKILENSSGMRMGFESPSDGSR
jgi:hypothetical protein